MVSLINIYVGLITIAFIHCLTFDPEKLGASSESCRDAIQKPILQKIQKKYRNARSWRLASVWHRKLSDADLRFSRSKREALNKSDGDKSDVGVD